MSDFSPPLMITHIPALKFFDAQGLPVGPQVAGLHESVLEFDPTGREMRPQG